MTKQDLMQAVIESIMLKAQEQKAEQNPAEIAAALMERLESLNRQHLFEPGQIVRYKKGLQNRQSCGPFIVCRMLETPLLGHDAAEAGSPYFREPLDMVVGKLDGDGDFAEYHVDSRRFEPVPKEELAA